MDSKTLHAQLSAEWNNRDLEQQRLWDRLREETGLSLMEGDPVAKLQIFQRMKYTVLYNEQGASLIVQYPSSDTHILPRLAHVRMPDKPGKRDPERVYQEWLANIKQE